MSDFKFTSDSDPKPLAVFRTDDQSHHNICCYVHIGDVQTEMIKVSPNGFWVRGKLVPQDSDEAEIVYKAFKRLLTESALRY